MKELFGWIPFDERTKQQNEIHEKLVGEMPRFSIRGSFSLTERRYCLWKSAQKVLGRFHNYNHQLTGSCVGAGGGNMLKTLMTVEIANGDPEEFLEPWWPYTYGMSRILAGMRGQGEGSLGSTWAKAMTEYGSFQIDPPGYQDLPDYRNVNNWLQLTRNIELEWSAGDRIKEEWKSLGKKHLARTVAQMHDSNNCLDSLANGYPLTLASNFGTRTIRPQGNPQVNLAEWNGRWPHQMFCDEAWDHPTLGLIFRIGNNWGSEAHPSPISGEPPGGFYIRASDMDKICRSEVYSFSAYDGFPARKLDWSF